MRNKIAFLTIVAMAIPAVVFAQDAGIPTGYPTDPYSGQYAPPSGSFGPSAGIPEGMMGPPEGQMGPSEEQIQAMQKRGEEQQIKGMKQAARGMESALKKFESTFASMEKKGMVISEETKQKLQTIRATIETIKNAQSAADLENVDQDGMQEIMQSLGDSIGQYQKMQGLKKMLASMERGLVSFEKRVAQLEKQGVVVPSDIKDDFDKLKAGMAAIKNATTLEELDAADPETLGDLMEKVNESRPRLEMIAKWPRVLRQADQQLARFKKELAKTKVLVDRLKAKEIDVMVDYATFEEEVNKIKAARDEADALMKAGQSEEAFNKLEEEFFNKLDDVGEHQRVIQMVGNLSRFTVEFKRGMSESQREIKTLERRKLDVSELKSIYDQALGKGNEIVALINAKPIDEDAILSAMSAMEGLKQDFQNKADELSGGQIMPWETKEKGQFQKFSLPKGFDKFVSNGNGGPVKP